MMMWKFPRGSYRPVEVEVFARQADGRRLDADGSPVVLGGGNVTHVETEVEAWAAAIKHARWEIGNADRACYRLQREYREAQERGIDARQRLRILQNERDS